jgi:hypothetical protein
MAYGNFKPTFWSKHIQHELEKIMIFKNDCDFKFEGEAGEGKRLKIVGVAPISVGTYTPGQDISFETGVSTSVYLDIDQYKYFAFDVDDVDKAQAMDGMMEAYTEEATRSMAENTDTWLAEQIAKSAGTISNTTSGNSAAKCKAAIDTALTKLWENGVRMGKDKITIYLPPWVYSYMQDQLITDKTQNDQLVKTGVLGLYKGAAVKMTNNVYNDGTDDYVIVKSSKAYAFCDGINSVEPGRHEKGFCDYIKGLHTYGGKMVRPKEAYTIKLHNGA